MDASRAQQRVDRWLWFARFFKSRTLAQKVCAGRRLRINRQVVEKTSATVRIGDVLTFPQGNRIRVVRVLALGQRRGPAPEAANLYEDLTPPDEPARDVKVTRGGRPTKRDRRRFDKLSPLS